MPEASSTSFARIATGWVARVLEGWAGLYPGTPDRHPIIDRLAEGLFVSMDFAGTGLMLAPAAGTLAAELIVNGGIRSVDPGAACRGSLSR